MALPSHRGVGLASPAAHQPTGPVSASGVVSLGALHRAGTRGRPAMAGPGDGFHRPENPTGLHPAGVLEHRSPGSMVGADRLVAACRAGLLVRAAGLDRTGL